MRGANTVNALKRAGCKIVWMGAESGSQKILNAMEKGTTVQQIRQAVRRLQDAGIEAALFLQFGYPGETWEDIQATLQMVRQCAPDDIGMSVSYPLPGTKFYESVKLQLGDKQNWIDSADLEMMYRGPFTTAFYRQLHSVLHKEFRMRRAWQHLKRLFSRPVSLRLHHAREVAASVYRLITLPFAWAKLRRLAGIEGARLTPPTHMTLDEAAQPSPQVE
jgi:anaerobic magnesium-protoporphyrin IX monomethyl ester cyclase